MHNLGYIHRDLKPDNILIDPKEFFNKVHLIDLGAARPYLTSDKKHTKQKAKTVFVGSPGFASISSHLHQT